MRGHQMIVSGTSMESPRWYLVSPDSENDRKMPCAIPSVRQFHDKYKNPLPVLLNVHHHRSSSPRFQSRSSTTTATMHIPTLLAALFATAATTVLAQDLSALPTCAQTCFDDNFANSACADTDIACLCADSTFFNDVEVCVIDDCDSADISSMFLVSDGKIGMLTRCTCVATLTWAETTCAAAGVPLKKRGLSGRRH